MSKLSALIKKAKKSPLVKGVVKLATTAIAKNNPKLGGQITKAGQVLKGAGISPIGAGVPKVPTNVAVLVAKSTPALPAKGTLRTAMPGGAAIKGGSTTSTRQPKLKVAATKKKPAKKKAPKAAKKPAAKKKGGTIGGAGSLDLKATSAKWKKAGSPGKWIDYVKAHGVRRK